MENNTQPTHTIKFNQSEMNCKEHTCTFQPSELVEEINDSQAMLMLPVTLFMVILMLVGFCGNLIVVVVFVIKKNKSIANYFMLSLGVIDLMR